MVDRIEAAPVRPEADQAIASAAAAPGTLAERVNAARYRSPPVGRDSEAEPGMQFPSSPRTFTIVAQEERLKKERFIPVTASGHRRSRG